MTSAAWIALPLLATFLAFFARVAAFMASAPFFSDPAISKRFKAGMSALFALGMTSAAGGVDPAKLPFVIPVEIALGAACGFAAQLIIAGVESGGELMAMHLGLGFSATIDPRSGQPSSAFRTLIGTVAGLAFFAADGPTNTLRALAAPLPGTASVTAMSSVIIARGGDVMVAAVRITAPVMLAAMITNVALAVASRAAPALNVFSVAFAGVLLVGGVILIITLSGLSAEIYANVGRVGDIVMQVAGAR